MIAVVVQVRTERNRSGGLKRNIHKEEYRDLRIAIRVERKRGGCSGVDLGRVKNWNI